MATYREVVYDISESISQTFDDKNVSLRQIAYWVQLTANKLQQQHFQKKGTSGMYLTIFPSVPVTIDNASTTFPNGRQYVVLPDVIHSLVGELGIEYITFSRESACCDPAAFTQATFMFTTPAKSQSLYYDPYTKPSEDNPYFYRVGDRIYLLGLECVNLDLLEMGLYTPIDIEKECDLDQQIKLNAELLSVLKYEVTNLSRWSLVVPSDRVNEGADMSTQAITQNKIKIPTITPPQQSQEDKRHQQQHQQQQQ